MTKRKTPNIGKVFYGKTKYIEKDTKPRRRYVIVNENESDIKVAKMKTIKKINSKGENIDYFLIEIDSTKYKGLTNRTGVDSNVFSKNRVTKQNLHLGKTNGVFDDKEQFMLDDTDYEKVDRHIKNAKTAKRKAARNKKGKQ